MSRRGIGFEADDNEVDLLDRWGGAVELPRMSKLDVADAILDRVLALRRRSAPSRTSSPSRRGRSPMPARHGGDAPTIPREGFAESPARDRRDLRHHRDLGCAIHPAVTRSVLPIPADALREQERARQGCKLCKLCKSRTDHRLRLGQSAAPAHGGRRGPRRGRGQAGHALRGPRRPAPHQDARRRCGFDRDRDCYIANVVKCRPERNRNPGARRGGGVQSRS